jgi:hypothetical protein
MLALALRSLADGFEYADRYSGDFAAMYDRLSSAVDALVNGEGLADALDIVFPGWRRLVSDPEGWIADHFIIDTAGLQDLIQRMVEEAVQGLNLAGQWADWLINDPEMFVVEVVRLFFPYLSPFFEKNEAGVVNWAEVVARGLMGLTEDIRRELGRALFGMLGLEGVEGEDLIITLIKAAFEWIEAHLPDFKEIALTAIGKVARYFLEGAM